MGQLALGIRSLLLRSAVFVVLAALLAWVLGGTLFPAPQRVNLPSWSWGGAAWNWRVTGSASDAGPVEWALVRRDGRGESRSVALAPAGAVREAWGPLPDEAMAWCDPPLGATQAARLLVAVVVESPQGREAWLVGVTPEAPPGSEVRAPLPAAAVERLRRGPVRTAAAPPEGALHADP